MLGIGSNFWFTYIKLFNEKKLYNSVWFQILSMIVHHVLPPFWSMAVSSDKEGSIYEDIHEWTHFWTYSKLSKLAAQRVTDHWLEQVVIRWSIIWRVLWVVQTFQTFSSEHFQIFCNWFWSMKLSNIILESYIIKYFKKL